MTHLCEALEVSRSAFYAWKNAPPNLYQQQDELLQPMIQDIFLQRKILDRAGMRQSMSRAGDCYDNAFMESCFGTIKTELEMTTYQSFNEALKEIQEYIDYFNSIRRHSSIDYQSPNRFELVHNP